MVNKKIETLSFEEAVQELEAIIEQMELENNSLEKSLKLYERGQALSKYCSQLLQNAELKIRTLSYTEETNEKEE